eukprot:COSAG02_NODE_55009_length_293_cov_0.530928_2_plen_33_part_01
MEKSHARRTGIPVQENACTLLRTVAREAHVGVY